MPKIVDHEQRRAEIAAAVWRVIRRDGVKEASVRTVAREAGTTPGALRHYFASQAELVAFAMELVESRVRARIAGVEPAGDPVDLVEAHLSELLPYDAERMAEGEVWLALTGAALSAPELREVRDRADAGMRELCGTLVDGLASLGALGAGRDRTVEADRLWAVVDGLALHLQLGYHTGAAVRAAMRRHLVELTRPAA